MKLLFFNDFQLGVLKGTRVVDVSKIVAAIKHTEPQQLISGLISNFTNYRQKLEDLVDASPGLDLNTVKVRPPLPKPTNIDCMAVNYMEDGTREEPAEINAFQKTAYSIIGPGDTMVLDDIAATIFEGEAELAVIIGKPASHVPEKDAMDYVFGYTCFVDGSARGVGPSNNFFFQMKSRDTFAPIGPCIVTADEVDNPQNLAVKLSVNGNVMQDFNTDDMAHSISRCIEWTSSIHALEPGDILATGTNHRGLSAFQDGDKVDLEIEGIGCLSINIRDDLKRTWSRDTRLEHAEKGLEGPHTPQLTGKYAP